MLLAEQVNAFFPDGEYRDILSFEADIAQISELILLFSESFGSAAELGSFVMYEEIAKKLLVVIDDKHYSENSFIKLGPIRYLEKKFGGDTVCVINRKDIGVHSIYNLANLDVPVFTQRMGKAVDSRKERAREHTSFDPNRPGHIVKLMVGLIQHYGALYIEEIEVHVFEFGVRASQERLVALLLCAELVQWIRRDKRGVKTYYAATIGKDAISYKFRAGVGLIDKERWRVAITKFWEQTDPDRFSSIQSALGAGR
jgi:hypothetical protein